ncbi:MAG: methylmalonyl-CoA mutase family protein [Balneolaceae bacterium]
MDSFETNTRLFNEFEPVSSDELERIIRRDLKGADYREELAWDTTEGFSALPFYRKDIWRQISYLDSKPGEPPYVRGRQSKMSWKPAELVTASDPADANKAALEAVKMGSGIIHARCIATPDAGMLGGDMSGTQIQTQEDFRVFLSNIDLTITGLMLESGMTSPAMVAMLLNLAEEEGIRLSQVQAFFLFDPWTYMAEKGRLPLPEKLLWRRIRDLSGQYPFKTLSADGLFYHRCGAGLVQELGIALAIGSEYLAGTEDPAHAARSFWMQLSAGSLYFPEIAKFRAARLLWSRIADAYGLGADAAEGLHIHAVTSPYNMTASESWNNMLRATTASMSAIFGGADSLAILPFDSAVTRPGTFSSRIARNVHHILEHESHLGKVADPAAGSYYVEALTDQIAKSAWQEFQMIEKQGGFQKALEGRMIQFSVNKSARNKENAADRGTLSLIGVNCYPGPAAEKPEALYRENPVDSLKISDNTKPVTRENCIPDIQEVFRSGGTVGDTIDALLDPQKQVITPLEPRRLALPFEELRTAILEMVPEERRKALLVRSDGDAESGKAADFARSFLGLAGLEVISRPAGSRPEEVREETEKVNPLFVVLCSSDPVNEQLARSFHDTYAGRPGPLLAVAGPDEPHTELNETDGPSVDFFFHEGMNIRDALLHILNHLKKRDQEHEQT